MRSRRSSRSCCDFTRSGRRPSLRACLPTVIASEATKQSTLALLRHGLLRGACHRARIRATRWLAMTWRDRGSIFKQQMRVRLLAAWFARALLERSVPREKRSRNAGCTLHRGLVCKNVRRNAHEHTGTVGTLRHPLRNGFTAYAVLSPATNSSCHRRCRLDGYSDPVGSYQPPTAWHQQRVSGRHGLPYAATRLRQQASPGFDAVRLRAD